MKFVTNTLDTAYASSHCLEKTKEVPHLTLVVVPVQPCNIGHGYLLDAFHLAGGHVGAHAKTLGAHLLHHCLGAVPGLYFTLRQQRQVKYLAAHEQHGRSVGAGRYTRTAADAGGSVEGVSCLVLLDGNDVAILRHGAAGRDVTACTTGRSPCLRSARAAGR